jgi:hypothetical protein
MVGLGAALLSSCSKQTAMERSMSPGALKCWNVARNLTRSPSTAKLVRFEGEGKPYAFVTMDAANAFGTPVRATTECTMSKKGELWWVDAANVDGVDVSDIALIRALDSESSEEAAKTSR